MRRAFRELVAIAALQFFGGGAYAARTYVTVHGPQGACPDIAAKRTTGTTAAEDVADLTACQAKCDATYAAAAGSESAHCVAVLYHVTGAQGKCTQYWAACRAPVAVVSGGTYQVRMPDTVTALTGTGTDTWIALPGSSSSGVGTTSSRSSAQLCYADGLAGSGFAVHAFTFDPTASACRPHRDTPWTSVTDATIATNNAVTYVKTNKLYEDEGWKYYPFVGERFCNDAVGVLPPESTTGTVTLEDCFRGCDVNVNCVSVRFDAAAFACTLFFRVCDAISAPAVSGTTVRYYHRAVKAIVDAEPANGGLSPSAVKLFHDCPGNLVTQTSKASLAACHDACAADGSCSHVTFDPSTGTNNCKTRSGTCGSSSSAPADFYTAAMRATQLVSMVPGARIYGNEPVVESTVYTFAVAEDASPGFTFDVNFNDTDVGDAHKLTLLTQNPMTSTTGSFVAGLASVTTAPSSKATVSVGTALDYESLPGSDPKVITLVLALDDGAFTSTVTASVTVTNSFENAPTFGTASPYATSIAESQAVGAAFIVAASALAPADVDVADGDNLTFSLSGTSLYLAIDATSGDVSLSRTFDFESASANPIVDVMTVKDSTSRTATMTISINVTNVNDNSPICSPGLYGVEITEGTVSADTIVQAISCSDADGSPPSLTYAVNETGFQMNGANLERKNGTTIDYDGSPALGSLAVEVTATDGATTATATVSIVVVPDNDNGPAWDAGMNWTAPALDENVLVATSVLQLTATDADEDKLNPESSNHKHLVYSIAAQEIESDSAPGTWIALSPEVFAIDGSTGLVKTKATLDKDANTQSKSGQYKIKVTVTDGGGTALTSVAGGAGEILLTIKSVNEFEPKCTSAMVIFVTLQESATAQTLATLTCDDDDEGADGTINYINTTAPVVNPPGPTVTEPAASGELKIANLEYATATSHVITVTVSDGTKSSVVTIYLTVTDSDGQNITIINSPLEATVNEGESPGTIVFQMNSTTGNPASVSYSILSVVDNDAANVTNIFTIDQSSGAIVTMVELDRDGNDLKNSKYLINVKASNAIGNTATATVTINVAAVNEHAPVCTASLLIATVQELPAADTGQQTIGTISCTDADNTPTSNPLHGTLDFANVTNSGVLFIVNTTASPSKLMAAVDFDGGTTSHSFVLAVGDNFGSAPRHTSNINVYVQVTDHDDGELAWTAAPPWTGGAQNETIAVGTSLFTAAATDNKPGVVYSIVSALDGGSVDVRAKFAIDSATGVLSNVAALDLDVTGGLTSPIVVTLKATDSDSAEVSGVLNLTVAQINEFAPTCSPSVIHVSPALSEHDVNTASGTAVDVTDITCTDGDLDGNAADTLFYSVNSTPATTAPAAFAVNTSAAQHKLTMTDVDYETGGQYVVTIAVTNDVAATPNTLTSTVTVYVNIAPVNEYDPVWTAPASYPHGLALAENVSVGSTVYAVNATDADSGDDGDVTYSFHADSTAGATSFFSIGRTTGVIRTTGVFDLEAASALNAYDLVVVASDGNGTPKSTTGTISVTITEYNEFAPVFSSEFISVSFPEPVSAIVIANITTYLTDADSDTPTYACKVTNASTPDADKFEFSSDTLQFKSSQIPEPDSPTSDSRFLRVIISCSDGATNPSEKTSIATVAVEITLVNDNAPVFQTHSPVATTAAPATVADDVSVGAAVITNLFAEDADAGTHGQLVYELEASGNTNGDFVYDWMTKELKVARPLDNDRTAGYVLTLLAHDQNNIVEGASNPKTANVTVTITVTDANPANQLPVCPQAVYSVDVSENVSSAITVATDVLTLACTDADAGSSLTYALASGDAAYFGTTNNASSANGNVQIKQAIDFDTDSGHRVNFLTVTVSDGTANVTITVIINVTPNNDGPPVAPVAPAAIAFDEPGVPGTSFGPYAFTDVDSDATGHGKLTYAFSAATAAAVGGFLHVEATTGKVFVNSYVDTDAPAQPIPTSVEIVATDENGAGTSTTATIALNITDVNDGLPVCATTTFAFTEPEVGTGTTTAAAVPLSPAVNFSCTDMDFTAATALVYAITSGSTALFEVDSATGALSLASGASWDHDVGSNFYFPITVTVSDGAHTVDITGYVTKSAVNDNVPVAVDLALSAAEGTAVGTSLGTFNATDGDSDKVLTFTWSTGCPEMTVNGATGELLLAAPLDYEAMASPYQISCDITTSDGGATDVTKSVTVTVTDVNDNKPKFNGSCTGTLPERSTTTTFAGAIAASLATDADATGSVTYNISEAALFQVDSNGDVKVAATSDAALDYETKSSYELTVSATSEGDTVTRTCYVFLSNLNDELPVFPTTGAPYDGSVDIVEDTAVGTSVTKVAATDVDGSTLTYTITGGDGNAYFNIDATSGVITVKAPLDRDTPTSNLSLEITANDGSGDTKSEFQILLTDVDDIAPACTPTSAAVSINENDAAAAVVNLGAICTDADATSPHNVITYSTTHTAVIAVNSTTGVVTLAAALDYETTVVHALSVTVSSGRMNTTFPLSINVNDVHENAPVFAAVAGVTLNESTAIGNHVGTYNATDADVGDTLTYSITTLTDTFNVNANTGQLILIKQLDYESMTSPYALEVVLVATDSDSNSATATLTVTVTDVVDELPVFEQAGYQFQIAEDTATGATVGSVSVTDSDAGDTHTYSATSTDFAVSAAGEITVSGATLDYDAGTRMYSFNVKVNDSGTPANTADVVVYVIVTNVNDFAPVIPTVAMATVTVGEDAAVGVSFANVAATDADSSATGDGRVRYELVTPNVPFIVDEISGDVETSGALDREATATYTLNFAARDMGSPERRATATATLTVNVGDVNDNRPQCTLSANSLQMDENTAANANVVKLTCTDADTAAESALTFSVASGNAGADFAVDGSGQVSTANALDYERTKSYVLGVKVDNVGTAGLNQVATYTVYVAVAPLNEHTPTHSATAASVNESAAFGTLVYTVAGTDDDDGVDGEIGYVITAGNTGSAFAINPQNGSITVNALDRETVATYNLEVTMTDVGISQVLTGTCTVTVTVTDENDNSPTCDSALANINEGAGANAAIAFTPSCTDVDGAPNDAVEYAITSGNTPAAFSLTTAGVLTSAVDLDAEAAANSYSLGITATNTAAPNLNTTFVVTVMVNDVNEAAPTFTSGAPANVNENVTIASLVHTVTANDSDVARNAEVSYSVVGGTGSSVFTIDRVSGEIRTSVALDYETNTELTLQVVATDSDASTPKSATSTLTFSIEGHNDNAPSCPPVPATFSVAEDFAAATVQHTVTCTDGDTHADSNVVTYSLVNNFTLFAVDATSGAITVTGALDYETAASYALVVRATDNGTPSLTGSAAVHVTLTPVNEDTPVITPPTAVAALVESTNIGSLVTSLTATDGDHGVHGQVRWSITAGDGGKFSIDNDGKVYVAAKLDRETTASYTLTVQTADSTPGTADEKTDTKTLSITLSDANDNVPTFNKSLHVATINEDAAVGSTVVTFTVADNDEVGHVNSAFGLTLAAGAPAVFAVTGSNLLVSGTLDADTTTSYTFGVVATDTGIPALSSTSMVTVNVGYVNDNPVVIALATDAVSISEDTAAGTSIRKVVATDADVTVHGALVFGIDSGGGGVFGIDQTSGDVFVSGPLDRDVAPDVYTMTISAKDMLGVAGCSSDTISLTVTLTDVNDNAPRFSHALYSADALEHVSAGVSLVTVTASDGDVGTNAAITYSLIAGNVLSFFSINPTTGVISTSGAPNLDYESNRLHILTVQAQDAGSTPLAATSSVHINVIDINDHTPIAHPTAQTVYIPEEAPSGRLVGVISATDDDTAYNGNGMLRFDFDSTGANLINNFELVAVSNRSARIQTMRPLDRETQSRYTLVVLTRDLSVNQRTATSTFSVVIEDINDHAPIISGPIPTLNVWENHTAYGVIKTLTVTDSDVGDNAQLRFSITPNSTLGINPINGQIFTLHKLDYEKQNQYTATVTVTDNGAIPKSSSTTININVLDNNDHSPNFTSSNTFRALESLPPGSTIAIVKAIDTDSGNHGEVSYSIHKVTAGQSSDFAIDASHGRVKILKQMNREVEPRYAMVVAAVDHGAPPLTTLQTIEIIVADANDGRPVFVTKEYRLTISEDTPVGKTLLQVSAIDNDIGINSAIVYSIHGSSDFHFTAAGFLVVSRTLDRERGGFLHLQAIAADSGSPSLQSSADVYITIKDINDNAPHFSEQFYSFECAYNEIFGMQVGNVSAYDPDEGDGGQVFYTMPKENTEFRINSKTGLLVKGSNDRLSLPYSYLIDVTATDAGDPAFKSTVKVRVDTFDPSEVVAVFQLDMSMEEFQRNPEEFRELVFNAVKKEYPLSQVRLLKAVAKSSSGNARRKRRATINQVEVHVYVVANKDTAGGANLDSQKQFIPVNILMNFVGVDSDSDTPSAIMKNSRFSSSRIYPYSKTKTDAQKKWHQKGAGIAIIVAIALLVLIILLVAVIVFQYLKRNRSGSGKVHSSDQTAYRSYDKRVCPPMDNPPEYENEFGRSANLSNDQSSREFNHIDRRPSTAATIRTQHQ